MITIDSTTLPTPSVYRLPDYDIDSENTGRVETGVLQRDRLRSEVYKVELEWWGLSDTDVQTIMTAVRPAQFSVTFLTESGNKTKTMYAGDKHRELVRYMGDSSKKAWNVSVNLIEY